MGKTIAEVVQKKQTPFKNPKNRGGSPRGVNDPPIFATRKMKKTIIEIVLGESGLFLGTNNYYENKSPSVNTAVFISLTYSLP